MALGFGLAKKAYKLIAVVAASVCTVSFSVAVFASLPVDSSTTPNVLNPNSGSITPIEDSSNTSLGAAYGQPFLLESGFANVNDKSFDPTIGLQGWGGSYFSMGCQIDQSAPFELWEAVDYYGTDPNTGNPRNLPFCTGAISTTKSCPSTGFVPVVKFTPASITTVSYTPIFACHLPSDYSSYTKYGTGVGDNTYHVSSTGSDIGYIASFATPAASSSNGSDWIPFISVKWEMWCYPTTQRTNTYTSDNTQAAPPSEACNIASADTLDTSPIIWDVGVINITPPTDPTPQKFNTTRHCPQNWGEYVAISTSTIQGNEPAPVSGEHESVGPSGICVQNVAANSENYTVTYLANATIMNLQYTNNSVTFNDPTRASMPNAHWVLYCYPPNVAPPPVTDPSSCNISQGPYQ